MRIYFADEFMQSFQVFVYLLLAIAAAAFAFTFWRSTSKRQPSKAGPRSAKSSPTELTPEGLLQAVKQLQSEGAQWPAILRTLNPANSARTAITLNEIRGPHMFVPHTALAVIEAACVASRRSGRSTTAHDVLVAAKESMEKVTRYGD